MALERSRAASADGAGPAEWSALLQRTSRTFALTIPMLPEPLQTEVAVAYLLFRIIDTFEDATRWAPARRAEALTFFARLMDGERPIEARKTIAAWSLDPPLEHEGYLELLRSASEVIEWQRRLSPAAGAHVARHVARSARAMAEVVARTDRRGLLALQTLQELRDYCFAVAGLVGEMLTELFLVQCPSLEAVAGDLRARSIEFGEALQLVNILKDAAADAAEGRAYLPAAVSPPEVFLLARADLRRAIEYTELLRSGRAAPGVVAFNALNARLAVGTLHLLRDKGAGAKLTRLRVMSIAAEVLLAAETGAPLFPESP
ncbi:MAG TPA: squalene/phytoene synthase family protein [Polyangia bacterium]|nr:squalene/phytoene synthase family protein [Polyangia bacterium]